MVLGKSCNLCNSYACGGMADQSKGALHPCTCAAAFGQTRRWQSGRRCCRGAPWRSPRRCTCAGGGRSRSPRAFTSTPVAMSALTVSVGRMRLSGHCLRRTARQHRRRMLHQSSSDSTRIGMMVWWEAGKKLCQASLEKRLIARTVQVQAWEAELKFDHSV